MPGPFSPEAKKFLDVLARKVSESKSKDDFKPGDKVVHKHLGMGRVHSAHNDERHPEYGARYTVRYPDHDMKLYHSDLMEHEAPEVKRTAAIKFNAKVAQPSAPPHPVFNIVDNMRPHAGKAVAAQKEQAERQHTERVTAIEAGGKAMGEGAKAGAQAAIATEKDGGAKPAAAAKPMKKSEDLEKMFGGYGRRRRRGRGAVADNSEGYHGKHIEAGKKRATIDHHGFNEEQVNALEFAHGPNVIKEKFHESNKLHPDAVKHEVIRAVKHYRTLNPHATPDADPDDVRADNIKTPTPFPVNDPNQWWGRKSEVKEALGLKKSDEPKSKKAEKKPETKAKKGELEGAEQEEAPKNNVERIVAGSTGEEGEKPEQRELVQVKHLGTEKHKEAMEHHVSSMAHHVQRSKLLNSIGDGEGASIHDKISDEHYRHAQAHAKLADTAESEIGFMHGMLKPKPGGKFEPHEHDWAVGGQEIEKSCSGCVDCEDEVLEKGKVKESRADRKKRLYVEDTSSLHGKNVRAHWNLHQGGYTVEDPKSRKVIAYTNHLTIDKPTFKVSEAGRQETLRTGVKNVHAHVVGTVAPNDPLPKVEGRTPLAYKPELAGNFFVAEKGPKGLAAGKPVHGAHRAVLHSSARPNAKGVMEQRPSMHGEGLVHDKPEPPKLKKSSEEVREFFKALVRSGLDLAKATGPKSNTDRAALAAWNRRPRMSSRRRDPMQAPGMGVSTIGRTDTGHSVDGWARDRQRLTQKTDVYNSQKRVDAAGRKRAKEIGPVSAEVEHHYKDEPGFKEWKDIKKSMINAQDTFFQHLADTMGTAMRKRGTSFSYVQRWDGGQSVYSFKVGKAELLHKQNGMNLKFEILKHDGATEHDVLLGKILRTEIQRFYYSEPIRKSLQILEKATGPASNQRAANYMTADRAADRRGEMSGDYGPGKTVEAERRARLDNEDVDVLQDKLDAKTAAYNARKKADAKHRQRAKEIGPVSAEVEPHYRKPKADAIAKTGPTKRANKAKKNDAMVTAVKSYKGPSGIVGAASGAAIRGATKFAGKVMGDHGDKRVALPTARSIARPGNDLSLFAKSEDVREFLAKALWSRPKSVKSALGRKKKTKGTWGRKRGKSPRLKVTARDDGQHIGGVLHNDAGIPVK